MERICIEPHPRVMYNSKPLILWTTLSLVQCMPIFASWKQNFFFKGKFSSRKSRLFLYSIVLHNTVLHRIIYYEHYKQYQYYEEYEHFEHYEHDEHVGIINIKNIMNNVNLKQIMNIKILSTLSTLSKSRTLITWWSLWTLGILWPHCLDGYACALLALVKN